MINTVKSNVKTGLVKIQSDPDLRADWIFKHAAQVIITCDSIIWSENTGACLGSDEPIEEMLIWSEQLKIQLDEVINLVRSPLTSIQRKTLTSLITQDVHYRDIIDFMKYEYIESPQDFKWQSQLRMYYEDDVVCRQINSKIVYGYEYLGIPGKLAITPLTDRCWMTITSAIHIKQGCSPSGPAGTGKTESVKDLAKNLGKFCVVINCTPQSTVLLMQQQFFGTIYTGAWICLDEFNRIDIEVLSVIAQQVLCMRTAL